jgi:hypothetical protein
MENQMDADKAKTGLNKSSSRQRVQKIDFRQSAWQYEKVSY